MPRANRPQPPSSTPARRPCAAALLVAALVLLAARPAPAVGAEGERPDPWVTLGLLVGDWEGEISGALGTGEGIRRYDWLKEGAFLRMRHRSVRQPQEKSPQGDFHEELTVFSHDTERDAIVYREFLIHEGIVVRSACDVEPGRVVCLSEHVEGGPGIRARLTLEITDRYHFTERYEIAWPGKELEPFMTNRWTRSPRPHAWP